MAKKSDTTSCLAHFHAHARARGHTIRAIKSDNDGVIIAGDTLQFCVDNGIEHAEFTTPPGDKQAGGRHESVIGVLWSHTMAALHSAPHVDHKFWPFVLETVATVRNNLVHSTTGRIPAVDWLGAPQDLSTIRTIGATVYAWQPKELSAE